MNPLLLLALGGGVLKDVVPGPVLWWGTKRPQGWRYIADEDVEFRKLLREARRA
jgi:hypothetical protein